MIIEVALANFSNRHAFPKFLQEGGLLKITRNGIIIESKPEKGRTILPVLCVKSTLVLACVTSLVYSEHDRRTSVVVGLFSHTQTFEPAIPAKYTEK